MMVKLLRTEADVLEAYRARIHELGLTHQTVDAIAGWADGYCSKLMCGMKRLGPKSRDLLNGALGIAFVAAADPEAAAKVQKRWVKRHRPPSALGMPLGIDNQVPTEIQITTGLQAQMAKREHMKIIGKRGGKRRLKTMGKRARQRSASHAARMRWAKRSTACAQAL